MDIKQSRCLFVQKTSDDQETNDDTGVQLQNTAENRFTEMCSVQTNFTLQPPNTDTHNQLLQHLIEDCLLQIFAASSLDLMDLCSISETCKRFRSITQRVVRKQFHFDAFDQTYTFRSDKFYLRTLERRVVDRIFRCFGSSLSGVSFRDLQEDFLFDLLEMLEMHCADEHLKYLHFSQLRISAVLAEELKPIFRRLQRVKLQSVHIEGNNSLFRELDLLVELEVESVKNGITILEHVFPQLERFTYGNFNSITESDEQDHTSYGRLWTFITRHTTLTSLAIHLSCDQDCWTTILKAIGSCTELLELSMGKVNGIDRLSAYLIPLPTFKSLQSVKLLWVSFKDFKVFAHLVELRDLKLKDCILPRDVEQFSCLVQLRKLSLTGCVSSGAFDLNDIIRELVNLEEMTYGNVKFGPNNFILNPVVFLKIICTVETRLHLLKIECCDSPAKDRVPLGAKNGKVEFFNMVNKRLRIRSSCDFGLTEWDLS